MAFVNLPTASLSFRLRDETGSIGRMQVHVPYATLAAVAITAADALATALNAITGCAVDGYELTYAKTEDTPETPADGSRVENRGQFIWKTADGRTSQFSLPGIEEAVLLPDGRIDQTDPLIAALVAAVTGVGAVFAGASGSDITALLSAYQRFKSTTKGWKPGA